VNKGKIALFGSIFVVLFFGFLTAAFALEQDKSPKEFSISEDIVAVTAPVDPVVEATTTTIDLSWLNTTTTTVPRVVVDPAPIQTTVAVNYATGDSVWDSLAQCESGGDWGYGLVNGTFSGGIMFATSTWIAQGGGDFAPFPYMASREQQIVIAEKTLASGGWGQWPGCSLKLGLR
jgi:hypothetical protein